MDKVNEDYWYNQWHLDFELHSKMGIKNVSKINPDLNDKNERIEPVSIYADTDSIDPSTLIDTDFGKLTIEDWYNNNIKNGSAGITNMGHESVFTDSKILNYVDGEVKFVNVKRIIRHKVSKPKWLLKTKSGKEISITGDHSMVIFRDGVKIVIKPSEIIKGDKVLSIL